MNIDKFELMVEVNTLYYEEILSATTLDEAKEIAREALKNLEQI
jgi:hypothetical protein